jgi:hypothetical protein
MREPNGGLFNLEPPRERRFANSKLAMDQKGGCGFLLHISQQAFSQGNATGLAIYVSPSWLPANYDAAGTIACGLW